MTETKPEAPQRWICEECDQICPNDKILEAPNPFAPEYKITGCPNCTAIESFTAACCVDGCSNQVAAGVPGGMGYRYAWFCSEHFRDDKNDRENG